MHSRLARVAAAHCLAVALVSSSTSTAFAASAAPAPQTGCRTGNHDNGTGGAFHPATPAPPGNLRPEQPRESCRANSASRDVRAAKVPTAPTWVVPARGTCTSGFGPRDGGFHEGLDIGAPIGTPIHAASDGTVIDVGPASGYGLWVRVDHGGGVVTTYGHNHRNLVARGASVHSGDVIAEVGNRGQSTGPHLHFQIDVHQKPVDPVPHYQHRGAPSLCGQATRGDAATYAEGS